VGIDVVNWASSTVTIPATRLLLIPPIALQLKVMT
jgi:hypothetical protein